VGEAPASPTNTGGVDPVARTLRAPGRASSVWPHTRERAVRGSEDRVRKGQGSEGTLPLLYAFMTMAKGTVVEVDSSLPK
jgi:hypothetical protein